MADAENPTDNAAKEEVELNADAGDVEQAGDSGGNTDNVASSMEQEAGQLSPVDTFKAAISLAMDLKAPYAFGSRLQVFGTRMIPIITVILLCVLSEDWKKEVDLPMYYRVTLFVHSFYFISACDCYELFGDAFGILITRDANYRMPRDNAVWFDKFVLGDLMFSLAAYYLILGIMTSAPVFALFLPIIQCSYNFRNDIVWMIGSMSPEEPKRPIIPFAFSDAAFIWTFGIIYVIHFCLEAR